jgi:hypothetical protein
MTAHPVRPLATSRYQNHELIIDSDLVPTRITLGAPRWKLRYSLAGHIPALAPTRAIFAIEDEGEFDSAYRLHLAGVGVQFINEEIQRVSAENNGDRGLVLLCFEDLEVLGENSCHRRAFARWWQEQTDQEVRELGRQEDGPAK